MSVLHLSATYVPEVVEYGQYEGGGGEVCLLSICYLLVCARVVVEYGQYEGGGGEVCLFYICLLPLCARVVVECGQ